MKYILSEKFILCEEPEQPNNNSTENHLLDTSELETSAANTLNLLLWFENKYKSATYGIDKESLDKINEIAKDRNNKGLDNTGIRGLARNFVETVRQVIFNNVADSHANAYKAINDALDTLYKESNPIDNPETPADISTIRNQITKLVTSINATFSANNTLTYADRLEAIDSAIKQLSKLKSSKLDMEKAYSGLPLSILPKLRANTQKNVVGGLTAAVKTLEQTVSKYKENIKTNTAESELYIFNDIESACKIFNEKVDSTLKTIESNIQENPKEETDVDWAAEIKAHTKSYDDYYNAVFGSYANTVKTFGTAFLLTLQNYGFSSVENPFVSFIKYMLKNGYKLNNENFVGVYQAVNRQYVRPAELRHTEEGIKTNILYTKDLYAKYNAQEIFNYLSAQRKISSVQIDTTHNSALLDVYADEGPQTMIKKLRAVIFNVDGKLGDSVNENSINLVNITLKPLFKIQQELATLNSEQESSDNKLTTVSNAVITKILQDIKQYHLDNKTACDFIIGVYNNNVNVQRRLIQQYKTITKQDRYTMSAMTEDKINSYNSLFSDFALDNPKTAQDLLISIAKAINDNKTTK